MKIQINKIKILIKTFDELHLLKQKNINYTKYYVYYEILDEDTNFKK